MQELLTKGLWPFKVVHFWDSGCLIQELQRQRIAESANKVLRMTVSPVLVMWPIARKMWAITSLDMHAQIRWMTVLSSVGAALIFCNNCNNTLDQRAWFSARISGWEMNTPCLCHTETERHDARPGKHCLLCSHKWGGSTLLTALYLRTWKGRALSGIAFAGG